MFALRTLPRALPRASRTLSTSVARWSDHVEPIIQGTGGKVGAVPTDLEQATGLERFELLYKLQGQEAFPTEALAITRLATLADPIKVFSLDETRIVGCTGYPVDSHDTIVFTINKDKPTRCPECGGAFQVDYHGVEHSHGHH